jgi:hypothetical protein
MPRAFWYHLSGRLSRGSFSTKAKATSALRKAREFYGVKGGGVIQAASDVDAKEEFRRLLERIGQVAD